MSLEAFDLVVSAACGLEPRHHRVTPCSVGRRLGYCSPGIVIAASTVADGAGVRAGDESVRYIGALFGLQVRSVHHDHAHFSRLVRKPASSDSAIARPVTCRRCSVRGCLPAGHDRGAYNAARPGRWPARDIGGFRRARRVPRPRRARDPPPSSCSYGRSRRIRPDRNERTD